MSDIDKGLRERFEKWVNDVAPYFSTAELTARFLLSEISRLSLHGSCESRVSDRIRAFISLCEERQK